MKNKKISLTLLTIITIVVSQLFFLTILNDIGVITGVSAYNLKK